MKVRFSLSPSARLPTRATVDSAGWDVYASERQHVPPGAHALLSTGLTVLHIPEGHYVQLASRSGLARRGVLVGAGVIDADYRGEIGVLLFNHSRELLYVEPGDRIAQMLVIPHAHTARVVEGGESTETERATGGFGSTGV